MITVSDADKVINKNIRSFGNIMCPLEEAVGAVLQEEVVADRDLPPFDKALMDGIAVKMDAYNHGTRSFEIKGTQSAGMDAVSLQVNDGCIEIATGAMLPKGCDCIIPIEQVKIDGNNAVVADNMSLEKMQHVRRQGSDHKKGTKLMSKGDVLLPPHVAVAASVGKAKIRVSAKPNIAIISTGDELIDIDANIKPYQIRKSNSFFLKAALTRTNLFNVEAFHFQDDKKLLVKEIGALLERFDAFVFTGGVSMGKFDFVPQVLAELDVNMLFHKVKQKPGKPFWFGCSKDGKPVFALPGNPVSTQVGTYRYVLPHLKHALGIEPALEYAILKDDYKLDTKFTFFVMVKIISNRKAQLEARPVITGGSGDFAAIANSDGFMELPADHDVVKAGFVGPLYRWN